MKIVLVLLLVFGVYVVKAQEDKITWLTVEEAEKLSKETPKPMIIDFYTDWCGWCKHMDKTTYADPTVIAFINRNFYPVKINAESKDTLHFRNKVYAPIKNGSRYISSLAVEMLGGKLSYPTTVFLYDKENINLVVPGYLDVVKMEAFIVFFTENAYQTTNVNDFVTDFEKVFKPEEGDKNKEPEVYWTEFKDLDAKLKGEKKKVLLYLSASWSNSAKMMEKVVFSDSTFAALAKKYYYSLRLDVQSKDTITFMTHQFANAGSANNNLHQLAIALSDNVLRIPGICIFDEDGKLMEHMHFYTDKNRGAMVLDFLGSDTYKNMSWADYSKMKMKEGF